MEENIKKKDRKLLLILLLLLLLIVILFYFVFGMGKKKSVLEIGVTGKYVPCLKTASDQPELKAGWNGRLYSAPLKEESSRREIMDNGVRNFSLSKMAQKDGDSVYFRLERTGFAEKEYVTGVKAVLEICDEKNETSEFYSVTNSKLLPAGEKISASVMHIHNNPKVFRPGKYRIDALMNIDGKWVLTNRIGNVMLAE